MLLLLLQTLKMLSIWCQLSCGNLMLNHKMRWFLWSSSLSLFTFVLVVLVLERARAAERIPELLPSVTGLSPKQHPDTVNHHAAVNHHWQPQPFPVNFQVSFVTNITSASSDYGSETPEATVATTASTIGGTLYYDWNLKSQRIDHDAGSYECVHFYNTTTQPCSLHFLEEGMYRVVISDEAPLCCLDLKGVGTPPPTWASDAKPTFNGMVHDEFTGLFAYQWTFDHLDPATATSSRRTSPSTTTTSINLAYHTTRQVALPTKDAGKPLVFSFPGKALGTQDYHYQVDTMVEGPPDPKFFQLPEGCKNVLCE
jgi:hypothetical protein